MKKRINWERIQFKTAHPPVRFCYSTYFRYCIIFYLSTAYRFGTAIEAVKYLNAHTFHISLYDLAFLGAIFIGLTFTYAVAYGSPKG